MQDGLMLFLLECCACPGEHCTAYIPALALALIS